MLLNKMFDQAPEIEIKNIMVNSSHKAEQAIFFCLGGLKNDGHDFVSQAIINGAIVIVHSKDLHCYNDNVTYIKVKEVKKVLNRVIKLFYKDPSSKLDLIGVTGTNGKTTICNIIKSILNKHTPTGYIGTLGVYYQNVKLEPKLTTLDILDNYKVLDDMIKSGVKVCAMEASSIGLETGRIDNLDFKYAIYTNLTHDHLDFHGNFSSYFAAKKILFDNLTSDAYAIVNADDKYHQDIVKDTKAKVITYAIDNEADFIATDIESYNDKTIFTLKYQEHSYRIETNLVAKFNISNLLASIATLIIYGLEINVILEEVNNIEQIDGRMAIINQNQDFNVIVDFAHTPDGVEKVMRFAGEITASKSRIITVFGSAGKRDVQKRKLFGELADKYCDMIILTEDDPRDESIIDIAEQIAEGIKNTNYIIIESRTDAIRQAIELAGSKDTILILGKGNEKFIYREFGKEAYIGDDEVAKEAIMNYAIIAKGEIENEL